MGLALEHRNCQILAPGRGLPFLSVCVPRSPRLSFSMWTVTRYVHLNPVRAGTVEHSAASAWSSYPRYAHRRRPEWAAYDELLASWGGAFGGSDPAGGYRRYVIAGLSDLPESPWKEAYDGWILRSEAFIGRVKAMVPGEPCREAHRESRLLRSLPLSRVIEIVSAPR